jgi:hypothetical protein
LPEPFLRLSPTFPYACRHEKDNDRRPEVA